MAYPEQYTPPTPHEILFDSFEADIEALDFRSVAYPLADRQLPKDLASYSFAAILPNEQDAPAVRANTGFPITYDFRRRKLSFDPKM